MKRFVAFSTIFLLIMVCAAFGNAIPSINDHGVTCRGSTFPTIVAVNTATELAQQSQAHNFYGWEYRAHSYDDANSGLSTMSDVYTVLTSVPGDRSSRDVFIAGGVLRPPIQSNFHAIENSQNDMMDDGLFTITMIANSGYTMSIPVYIGNSQATANANGRSLTARNNAGHTLYNQEDRADGPLA